MCYILRFIDRAACSQMYLRSEALITSVPESPCFKSCMRNMRLLLQVLPWLHQRPAGHQALLQAHPWHVE
jgi:hypothetical protein